ncbi:hypothetical protein ACH5RR_039179 [Cinchona calisaya]|uniref:Uncharacterized protein n=1 Tax=Cinchona calisaya TaxID=153742 RepID=A0ABD2XZ98_9GENT
MVPLLTPPIATTDHHILMTGLENGHGGRLQRGKEDMTWIGRRRVRKNEGMALWPGWLGSRMAVEKEAVEVEEEKVMWLRKEEEEGKGKRIVSSKAS